MQSRHDKLETRVLDHKNEVLPKLCDRGQGTPLGLTPRAAGISIQQVFFEDMGKALGYAIALQARTKAEALVI